MPLKGKTFKARKILYSREFIKQRSININQSKTILLRQKEKCPIGRFLLAGLQFCGNCDFCICVFDLLTLSENSVKK